MQELYQETSKATQSLQKEHAKHAGAEAKSITYLTAQRFAKSRIQFLGSAALSTKTAPHMAPQRLLMWCQEPASSTMGKGNTAPCTKTWHK